MNNVFINAAGDIEVRKGLEQKGTTITNVSAPDLKSLHEIVYPLGTAQMIVTGSVASTQKTHIWALDTSAETTWTQVYASGAVSARYDVAQFDDKLILVNGVDRNLVTTDVSAFDELVPLIRQGEAEATATAHDKLQDSRITDWVTETDVVENDLLFNVTTSAGALITNVGSAALTHQPLTAASPGFMSGNAAKAGGDRYQIRDLVELNIIPTGGVDPDNIALAGNGSSATRTQVSALNGRVNFANTEVAVGDFIRNTTRNNVARITGVSGNEIQHTTFGAAYAF